MEKETEEPGFPKPKIPGKTQSQVCNLLLHCSDLLLWKDGDVRREKGDFQQEVVHTRFFQEGAALQASSVPAESDQ